jgi:cytochrome o ubiquinol oxidase subunit 2
MMNNGVLNKRVWIPIGAALATCLSGCGKLDVLDPKGSIGVAEKSLIGTATFTMLIVVVPVT